MAYQFQLNALPALAVVKESRVVGILQGDEIVPNYENLLNDYIPQEDQLLADEAAKLLQEQKTDEALSKINKALQLKNQTRYRLIKADIFINCSIGKYHRFNKFLSILSILLGTFTLS